MWDKIKSATVVSVITVLIWFTADQNVSEEQTFSIPVKLVSTDPNRYAGFAAPPYQMTFSVTAVGRRRHLKELADAVASKPLFEAVVSETMEASARPQTVGAREILGLIREVSSAAVRLRSIEPAAAVVRIDEYQTVTGIRVSCGFGDLKVSAKVTPSSVSARLPRFAAERLRADPSAQIDVEERVRAARKTDGSFQIKVPITFSSLQDIDPDAKIEILPGAEAVVTGQIQELTATKRKGPIQITWSIPQSVQSDFRVVPEPSINLRPDIDVSGPRDLVDQLDAREIWGYIEIRAADTEKPRTMIRRPVQFVLPTGFSLAAGSPSYEVAFMLEPREPTANQSPGP